LEAYLDPKIQAFIRYLDFPGNEQVILYLAGLGLASTAIYPIIAIKPGLSDQRSILVDLFGTLVRIGTAEDTLVNKILFQGEQDLRDALGILKRNPENLDFDYIQSTSHMLGIEDLLQHFLKDSESKNL